MIKPIRDFLTFVQKSPTAFQAAQNMTLSLEKQGFSPLCEKDVWSLQPGGRYYVTRNRSAVIAFTLPEAAPTHFQIVASHSDSPTGPGNGAHPGGAGNPSGGPEPGRGADSQHAHPF